MDVIILSSCVCVSNVFAHISVWSKCLIIVLFEPRYCVLRQHLHWNEQWTILHIKNLILIWASSLVAAQRDPNCYSSSFTSISYSDQKRMGSLGGRWWQTSYSWANIGGTLCSHLVCHCLPMVTTNTAWLVQLPSILNSFLAPLTHLLWLIRWVKRKSSFLCRWKKKSEHYMWWDLVAVFIKLLRITHKEQFRSKKVLRWVTAHLSLSLLFVMTAEPSQDSAE